MKHFLFFMVLGCSIAANASAAEPKPNTPTAKPSPVVGEPVETLLKSNTVAVDLKPVPVTGRKQLEALLLQPAKLDFGERKSASVKEILQQLREKHHLSIRFDLPTLAALFGIDAVHQQLEHKVAPVAQMSGGIIDLKKTKSRYQDPGYHPPMGPLPPRYLPDSNEVESLPSVLVSEDSAPAAASPGASPVPTPVKAAKAPVTVAPVSAPAPFIKLLRMVSEEKSGKEAVATVTADLSEPEAATTEKQDDATPKEMPQAEEVEADESASETETPASGPTTLETFLNLEVNLETIDLQNLTIATALRQTLDSVPSLIAADVIEPWGGGKWHMETFRSVNPEPEDWNGEM